MVKAVVVPLAGQSYNPSAKDHNEVIQKVVAEEVKEVQEAQRILRSLKPYLFKDEAPAQPLLPKKKTIDNDSDSEIE